MVVAGVPGEGLATLEVGKLVDIGRTASAGRARVAGESSAARAADRGVRRRASFPPAPLPELELVAEAVLGPRVVAAAPPEPPAPSPKSPPEPPTPSPKSPPEPPTSSPKSPPEPPASVSLAFESSGVTGPPQPQTRPIAQSPSTFTLLVIAMPALLLVALPALQNSLLARAAESLEGRRLPATIEPFKETAGWHPLRSSRRRPVSPTSVPICFGRCRTDRGTRLSS